MTLIHKVFDGEILSPREMVRVVGRAHVLAGDRFDLLLPAGSSISELLELAGCAGRPVSVRLGGYPIKERNFGRIRLKPGATLTVVPLAGNSNLRTVLSAVVALAALVIAPYAAPGIATAFAAIGVTVSAATATALAAGAIMLAGTFALNALFPVRPSAAAAPGGGSLNSIQGASNQSNPFGAVPVVLGRHRQSPFYAAKPYTEISGSDQYLRLLFCLGYGPLLIEDLRIGETPLTSFSNYQLEVRQGFVGDAPVTLYPGSVDELSLSIEMDAPANGLYSLSSPGAYSSQTTAPNTDQISLDFTAPQGNYITDQNGVEQYVDFYIEVQYRIAGSGSGWTAVSPQYITFQRSTDPIRRGIVINVARNQYEVRARRANSRGAPEFSRDQIVWTALRSIKNVAPINFPKPLALVALRIKASDQLSGVINTFNCITTSLVKSYSGSGSTWNSDTASQNPADLMRHVLQSPANARAVPDSELDLPTLQAFWTYCNANGFKFNQVVTSAGSVQDKLADIAAAGRAVPIFRNGLRSVVWDRPNDTVVDHYTPRNSWGLKGSRIIAQQPHGWRVTFINEENGFTQDERVVYDDGYDANNATLFEGIQFPGVTDPDLIWRHGRFHIAQARLRPEAISINVGWDQLVAGYGDRIEVAHDVLMIGLAQARVEAIAGQVVTLDEICTIEAGKTYSVTFRVADDSRSVTRAVAATPAGDYSQLTLVGSLSLVEVGNLAMFGETNQTTAVYRVKEIRQQRDLVATLVLVDDAPAIALADQGVIPAYVPNVTIPADPFTLPPRDFRYAEIVDGDGASGKFQVALTWQVPRFGNIRAFEVQWQDVSGGAPFVSLPAVVPPATSTTLTITRPGSFSFRVRCLFDDGSVSAWASILDVLLQGVPRAPGGVANLRNTYISGRSFLSWDNPADVRTSIKVEIRKGTSFVSAQIVEDAGVSPWQTVGDDTYFVTPYVTSPFGERIYSSSSQSITITGSVAIENIIVSHDERAEGWTGSFVGSVGVDTDNNFLRTAGVDDFLGRGDFLGTGNFLDGDGTVQGGGIYWSATIVDTGGVNFCRVSNNWTATGVAATDDFLGNPDFLGNLDFLKASLAQFVRVRPVIRVSQTGPSPSWGAMQVWSPDVYQGRMFQLGIQFEILDPTQAAIAYLLSWSWSIDVPDRLDSYQELVVPAGAVGLPITFRPSGSLVDVPFNGGLNNEPLPHVTPSIQNPNAGDQVVWSSLSLSGVTLKVMNGGVSVGGSRVNLLVRGF